MTTIDYGPDVATLRAQLAEARAKVARLAKERDAQAANTVTIHKHMPTVPFVIGPPDDARIVAIVREWGGGGPELPSRLRNNGDYTTAALVEALRGVVGGSDAC